MTYTPQTAFPGRHLWLLLVLLACALPVRAEAQHENRLRRIQIVPHAGFTRINLYFQDPPQYTLSVLPGRIRLNVRATDSPIFRKFRAYSDARISGVYCTERDGGLRIVIPVKEAQPAVQALANANPTMLSVDVGAAVKRVQQADIAPGREPILSGTEKFVREFGLPARSGLPFVPTDTKMLKGLLSDEEVALFQQGEGLLYREQPSEAIPIFSAFINKTNSVRALAWYRLALALSMQERTDEALKAFRQAEALWPSYLDQAPELLQAYAEVLGKSGDFVGGRKLLVRLTDRLAGTAYAAPLLNRLADMTQRHGETALAVTMYRSVVINAPGSEAAGRARMKIADLEMFSLSRDRYRALLARYRAIYEAPGEFSLRDEALFKMALLQALYGPAKEALEAAAVYDKRYPRGIFSTILKKMREELLLLVYREVYAAKDPKALVQLALDNKEYLARCLSDADFPGRLAQAFRDGSMLSKEIPLFGYLSERTWAAGAAPFMSARMVEDALGLGNLPLAESSARSFLTRFPADARVQRMRELLGRIAFEKKDLKGVVAELSFLNDKGKKAEIPESDYYLGKALASTGDDRGAERSLGRFVALAPAGSPFLVDGYFAVGGARAALKEYPGALAAYQEGAKLASGENADQFLYKMGELYLQLKMVRQATEVWEKVAGRAGGGTWSKLAAEALSDLKWRLKISSGLP
jgi:tetratricopeptide (TPR) repeat protein